MKSGYNLYLGRSVPENNLIHTTWVFNWGGWWSRHQDFQMQVRRNSPRHLVLWGSSVVWCFLQVHPCTCVTCLSEWSDAQSTMDQSLKKDEPKQRYKETVYWTQMFFWQTQFHYKTQLALPDIQMTGVLTFFPGDASQSTLGNVRWGNFVRYLNQWISQKYIFTCFHFYLEMPSEFY